jgi:molybdopterin-guanine dinucleotide biosynthesis protein
MRIVVGGQARKAGKTALVCRLIAALPQFEWTAVKISGHGHGLTGADYDLREEMPDSAAGDTRRYLEAGARHAWWLRGDLEKALPALRAVLARSEAWIVESTRAIGLLEYDVALMVVSRGGEVKDAARRFQDAASALVTLGGGEEAAGSGALRLYQIGDAALVEFVLNRGKGHFDHQRPAGSADRGFETEH